MKNKIRVFIFLSGLLALSCEKLEITRSEEASLGDVKEGELKGGPYIMSCKIADAVVSNITIINVEGDTFTYNFTVANTGGSPLPLSQMYFQAYISEDSVFGAGDQPAGGSEFGDTAPTLNFGEEFTQDWYYNFTTPENLTQYHYVIVQIFAKPKFIVNECSMDNNTGVQDIGCNLAEAVISTINITNVNATANTFDYTFTVKNTGWGTLFLDRMLFQTYVSKDSIFNAGDKPAGGAIFGAAAPALAKDESYSQYWYYNPTTPENLSEYKYLLIQLIVWNGSMPECSTDNNTSAELIRLDIPRNGLVAFYPFNYNANDESGNGLHGTAMGPSLTTDRFGSANKAYGFDGIDDYIMVGNPTELQITNAITLSLWIKNISFTPYLHMLSKTQTTNQSGTEGHGYSLMLTQTGNGEQFYGAYIYYPGYGPGNLNFAYGAPFTANEWVHFTYTLEGQNAKWYKNGEEANSVNNHQPLTAATLGDFVIGKRSISGFNFDGLLDDIAVYNRALSATEVQQLYHQNISQ